ncbi:hypothetical protein MP228_009129 [Amoeboaphelidium protococcarum]|nr:hypothetical protein MP228_009129 [Amoeboaphelidium protococcarum]
MGQTLSAYIWTAEAQPGQKPGSAHSNGDKYKQGGISSQSASNVKASARISPQSDKKNVNSNTRLADLEKQKRQQKNKKKGGGKLNKAMIGGPSNFQHTTHVGSNDMQSGAIDISVLKESMNKKPIVAAPADDAPKAAVAMSVSEIKQQSSAVQQETPKQESSSTSSPQNVTKDATAQSADSDVKVAAVRQDIQIKGEAAQSLQNQSSVAVESQVQSNVKLDESNDVASVGAVQQQAGVEAEAHHSDTGVNDNKDVVNVEVVLQKSDVNVNVSAENVGGSKQASITQLDVSLNTDRDVAVVEAPNTQNDNHVVAALPQAVSYAEIIPAQNEQQLSDAIEYDKPQPVENQPLVDAQPLSNVNQVSSGDAHVVQESKVENASQSAVEQQLSVAEIADSNQSVQALDKDVHEDVVAKAEPVKDQSVDQEQIQANQAVQVQSNVQIDEQSKTAADGQIIDVENKTA